MSAPQRDISDRWTLHKRQHTHTTRSWTCRHCRDKQVFQSSDALIEHTLSVHRDLVSADSKEEELREFWVKLEAEALTQRRSTDEAQSIQPRKSLYEDKGSPQPEPQLSQTKRPLASPGGPPRSLSELQGLKIDPQRESEDTDMQDVSDGSQGDQPRKRAAVGDGISAAGSGSPYRERSDSPPRRSKARQTSESDLQRPHVPKPQLWTPEMDSTLTRSSFSPSNIASVQASKSRSQNFNTKSRKPIQSPSQPSIQRQNPTPSPVPVAKAGVVQIFGSKAGMQPIPSPSKDDNYDIILQPETRPISQEQLVAEVKGIYAGLVMVEAKCIEVDNKQATLAQAEAGAPSKLNNEQWQALIALHRTLLHEHHDFFLASQHPSASPALRRLAQKYAMPARMWRHGIHSFLELLRHRLPASLDHMLAFIYLAYSMMALLYETVPAFEDTWIECLGDLGRYRMAIEDDDIRDREVWTGVARHWYSKASDKAPTTGRLYHHLAILARPNALQQLFYYAKSLCVDVPFVSARESILTLFDPVLNADNGQGQYRLPPLDTAFVKAHGIMFTGRNMERFDLTVKEFLGLLDNQIGRVTRKFMEQGYYIAVSNIVVMFGFASKENVLMKCLANSSQEEPDTEMTGTALDNPSVKAFLNAENLTNQTLEIVLQRIGDPNVLPFIHVTLVFMFFMSSHPRAMRKLEAKFPWQLLTVMLNTLLATYPTLPRIESNKFPLPIKDDVRPFTEDFAMRGLLWTDGYYPDSWFANDKIEDEEKYLEVASMTDDRKERILWLACRLASAGSWIYYDGKSRQFSTSPIEMPALDSRVSTFTSIASNASVSTVGKSDTWTTVEANIKDEVSDEDRDEQNWSEKPLRQPIKKEG